MHLVFGRASLRAATGRPPLSPAYTIGNFDGMHLGHRRLLDRARRLADARGGEVGVLTFEPHPAKFFAPELAPPLIFPLSRRIELLAEAGADLVVVEPFTAELARTEAAAFVRDILAGDLAARDVVVGHDFSFGRGRSGDIGLLARLGEEAGIGVTVVPAVTVDGLVCSSTKIREFVLEGRVEGAALLLGKPFEITGDVIAGSARGRTLGVPTANLRPDGELVPRSGVYAAIVRFPSEPQHPARPAAVSVGTNPTFETGGQTTIEAHLLDFTGDLYGRRLRLELVRRLRDEQRFAGKAALAAQIQKDIARAREVLGNASDTENTT